ncbi:hypothetical protein ACGF1Z_31320 [Streptomyces sp. NPDC048018]|uniref:hypothetical protein n=1 Tax=Streptomyces sp. NPDC048018 TaxID=3365499 RepID=UPI0037227E03
MRIAITETGAIEVTFSPAEAEAIRDDLGGIPFTKVTPAGDKLHSLLEAVTGAEKTPAKSYEELKAECNAAMADADVASHPSRI